MALSWFFTHTFSYMDDSKLLSNLGICILLYDTSRSDLSVLLVLCAKLIGKSSIHACIAQCLNQGMGSLFHMYTESNSL